MIKSALFSLLLCLGAVTPAWAQTPGQSRELGRLPTGASVSFNRGESGDWGIEITGSTAPAVRQTQPVRFEIYRADDDIAQLAAGYRSVEPTATGLLAQAEVTYSNATFHVRDQWSLDGAVLSLHRQVVVTGAAAGGFDSAFVFDADPATAWTNVNFLAPGALYGDTTYDGARSSGGTLNDQAHHFVMREDILAAPLFAARFADGSSLALLDPAPRGDTTVEETRLARPTITDARLQFGALGAWQNAGQPIQFGFVFPGTSEIYPPGTNAGPRMVRRYHPITPGFSQSYQVDFRFGHEASFRDLTRDAWRWAWNTLNPKVYPIDVEQMRRVLLDHLEANVDNTNGNAAIPFAILTLETNQVQWNYTMAAMGFVGKDIECANQLLLEGDRDSSERGQKMRQNGLAMIATVIRALPTVPLEGIGFDVATGKPWDAAVKGTDHNWLAPWLRNATEDMRVLMQAYQREKALARDHPEWLAWVKQYADWLVQQQRTDGSFPRRWERGSSVVAEASGTSSYCPVPLLVLMTQVTGDQKYLQAAIRAADYIWTNFGSRGVYVGGAIDNPNLTDKEAGMLSMEAFLSLYDFTKDPRWLDRAQSAATFAESWIWIWNVPMPVDATDAQLHWKQGVPALGFQGITAGNSGSVDEYLDWAVPSYAKLYKYTGDRHYYDVARVLLHDTKFMVALPGRLYDMRGPGWQQEGWRMGPGGNGRGVSGHRFWLPWVSANHLHGITGLDELDPALYRQLSQGDTNPPAPR
jgi:hypothetical protein